MKTFALFLAIALILTIAHNLIFPADRTITPERWEQLHRDTYNVILDSIKAGQPFEYHVNISLQGYEIFNDEGRSIGWINYGNCTELDTVFINDNL